MNSIRISLMIGFAFLATSATSSAEDANAAAQFKFFESRIRPLLAKRCFKCHADKKQKGGLRLDARSLMLKGGESGATIVPGKPDESLLIEAVRYESLEMPPDGKLKPDEINLLVKWVADGAFWPAHDAEPRPVDNAAQFTDEDRQWWAFQPVSNSEIPQADGDGWARNEIDHFIWRKLAEQKMTPAPEADRRTLVRRLYFDLTGLPPSAAEVADFVNAESPDAYVQLVDRLLDSPRYGERQARHWLDLVRYSESDGYRKDDYRPTLWRYRDWVINSFNADKPFDRFVQEQIAGDEIDPDNPEAVVATAYWRLYLYEYNQRDVRTHWQAIVDELTDVSGEVFLGLGMGCAKCHDHKFDPILRDDYLRFQAFFSSILPRDDLPLGTREQKTRFATQKAAWEAATKDIRDQISVIRQPHEKSKWRDAVEKFPPDIRVIAKQPESEWKALDRQLMDLVDRQVYFEYSRIAFKDEEEKKKLTELEEQLKKFDDLKPAPLPVSFTVTDAAVIPAKTITPGDSQQRDIPPGHLTLLNPAPAEITRPETVPNSTGRRSALAAWLSDPENPLATRVAVNRIWLQHFGTGIVATASDFGRLGELPSHPELLDWLTTAFLESGWSTKALHRMIVLSATYRQSAFHPDAAAVAKHDPRNRLRWRWDIRRLDAEQIRDAMLAASGELDLKTGGPSVDAKTPRRSIYTKIIRNSPDHLLKSFDATDGFNSTDQRQVTTTPTQSLLMINGAWPLDRAKAFAKRVDGLVADSGSPGSSPNHMAVQTAWRLAYGRSPNVVEVDGAVGFLDGVADEAISHPALTAPLAATDSAAANISADDAKTQWKFGDAKSLPDGDFTIEAVIHLRSLFPNASVRTIVSHWNGSATQRGWNFGVTSTKSGYQPRNLILQLVGSPPGQAGTGKPTYEVIASNLRPELNRPYYVAVSVNLAETSDAGITFYLKDLSQPDAKLQTAAVPHKVTAHFRPDLNLVLGDRDGRSSRWDGLLDNIRISAAALKADELLINSGAGRRVVGFWQFNQTDAAGTDASPAGNHLAIAGRPARSRSGIPEHALADLCHVILNSNEFLYLD